MIQLSDDKNLFNELTKDASAQNQLYKPGKYWIAKTQKAVKEIKNNGLSNFRSSSSVIGMSYADNPLLDYRIFLNNGLGVRSLRLIFEKIFPFNFLYDNQVRITAGYLNEKKRLEEIIIKSNTNITSLLDKYNLPYSLLGNCEEAANINGKNIAKSYLEALSQHDFISEKANFKNFKSLFEIGGGFGMNLHLLIENYPNLKKFYYLDITPNLYVGTQYLKSFYGDCVKDYLATKNLEKIEFSDNDELEIFAIAPWQIEKISSKIDCFYNSSSFVEMPEEIVSNYSKHIERLSNPDKTKIILVTYDCFDLNTTINPDKLPTFFPKFKFNKYLNQNITERGNNIFYISQ